MLYETMVLPYLRDKPNLSVLDFGCGKGAYITQLSKHRRAVGIEFYNNNSKSIDVTAGNAMIDKLCKEIADNGPFDVVVCDSVLNSVDSLKAEKSVMTCLNLFCNGKCFISGRPRDRADDKMRAMRSISLNKRYSEFMDDDGFTATYRAGNWYYQHYQTKEQVRNLALRSGFEIEKITWGKHGDSYQASINKIMQPSIDEATAALNFEFDLPLPNGRSYGRQDDIIEACHRAGILQNDARTANCGMCKML
jgi:ParB family chromosome partitioning protein